MDCPAITPTASPGCTMARYHFTCIRRWKSAGRRVREGRGGIRRDPARHVLLQRIASHALQQGVCEKQRNQGIYPPIASASHHQTCTHSEASKASTRRHIPMGSMKVKWSLPPFLPALRSARSCTDTGAAE